MGANTAALVEMVVFARERGGEEDPRVRRICKQLERQIAAARERMRRRQRGRDCERCGGLSTHGLLCFGCLAEAPEKVRFAFRDGDGLDGMRKATALVRNWAHGTKRQTRRASMSEEVPLHQESLSSVAIDGARISAFMAGGLTT